MDRIQPICAGLSASGELEWSEIPMELWQVLQLYRKQYQGDFSENWMRLIMFEKYGIDWAKGD